jgi:hypothetical protein
MGSMTRKMSNEKHKGRDIIPGHHHFFAYTVYETPEFATGIHEQH